ncbi:hypothetical protein GCM10023187_52650 [Nibrella viscosa]|uniref:Tetratricopeptide repeat-containing protein n=1 Tax=Nibrella viscosa TaxID=1084524 RepID=A0ABP8KXU4_9BACT
MELDETIFDRIHRYLAGRMDEPERQQFVKQMELDEDLRTEVEIQRQIKAAYQISRNKTLLDEIHKELQHQGHLWQPPKLEPANNQGEIAVEPVVRKINWGYIATAACVVLALGFGWYFYLQNDNSPTNEVTKQEPEPNLPDTDAVISPGLSSPEPIQPPAQTLPSSQPRRKNQADTRYAQLFKENFKPTVRHNPEEPADKPRFAAPRSVMEARLRIPEDTAAILAGIQLLRQGKIRQAITRLQPATDCALPDWQANAQWFLALAYLRNNQPAKARPLLQRLTAEPTELYQSQAQRLLTNLDQ